MASKASLQRHKKALRLLPEFATSAPIGLAACEFLEEDDCMRNPTCSYVKNYMGKGKGACIRAVRKEVSGVMAPLKFRKPGSKAGRAAGTGRAGSAGNRWVDFAKAYQASHPGMSYRQALSEAAPEWHKRKGQKGGRWFY